MRNVRPFLALWTLAVAATVAAFVLHLALRGRTMQLGYELGKVRGEQARLREVRRVLEVEAAFNMPQASGGIQFFGKCVSPFALALFCLSPWISSHSIHQLFFSQLHFRV